MKQTTEAKDAPSRTDWASISGDHEQKADVAVMLSNTEKTVKVHRGNCSTTLKEDKEYSLKIYDDHTKIIDETTGWVATEVNDDSDVSVFGR